ncbi:MAG: M23 family metallopeptidase, partial [Caldilineae bacterium]
RNAIKAQPGHEEDQVLVGAVAPWNNNTAYAGNESGDWVIYFRDILAKLGPLGCDGITLHTYTHGPDPALITADTKFKDAPFQDRHYDFQCYRDFMEAIPANMRHLPVYITETDQDHAWHNANNGWVKAAYEEIHRWNSTPGRQQIRALVLYRWPPIDKWVIQGKQGVIEDFSEALQREYRWNPQVVIATPPSQLKAAPFRVGTRVYTTTVVRLRRTPGVTGKDASDTVAELPVGTAATILGGPEMADNYVWWRIGARLAGESATVGWAAQALDEETPLLSTQEPQQVMFTPGEQVFTQDMVRLRRTPGFRDKPESDVLVDLPMDARATVVGGPQAADGLTWWKLEANVGGRTLTGWAAQTTLLGQPLLAPAETVTAPEPLPAQPVGKYAPGQTLYAATYVNLRRTPGYVNKTGDDVLVEIPYGETVTVEAGPRQADELTWWQVRYRSPEGQSFSGWVAEAGVDGTDFFRTEPPPPPQRPETVTPIQTYTIGMSVCNLSPYEVNVRRTPGFVNKPSDDVVASVPSQALLRLVDGPRQADGLFWWQVQWVENPGVQGWMAEVSPGGVRLLAPALYRGLIHLSVPYEGDHPVSQLWGENADFYRRFTYDGVPLRGHNGIDIYMPTGSRILAADSGTVAVVDFNAGGFGNWVRVDHRWGHSVYAHMNRAYVRVGQQVQRGDVLGESDNTGNSTGPHLHFSIRITPYRRDDGWGGYCDPLPFMDQSQLNLSLYGRDPSQMPDIPRFEPTPPPPDVPGKPMP